MTRCDAEWTFGIPLRPLQLAGDAQCRGYVEIGDEMIRSRSNSVSTCRATPKGGGSIALP
jgi:hypothetical protein